MKLKDLIKEVHPGKFSQDKDTLKGKDVVKVSARIQRKAEDLFKKEFGKKGTKLSILHYRFKNPKDQQNFISKLQKLGASTKDLQTENENPCWDGYKQVGMKTKNGRQVPNCVKESVNEAKIVGSYPRRKEPHYSGIPTSKSSTEELVHTYIDTALISGYPFDDEDDNPNFDSGRQQADMKLSSYSQMLKKRGFDRRKLDKLVDTVRKKQTYPKIEENLNEKRVKQAVSGGKVHKFITGKNLTYKGKKYADIEFELLGIDNREQLVKLKILAPKNLFGQEMNVPFRTIRRGPFIKTDTSK